MSYWSSTEANIMTLRLPGEYISINVRKHFTDTIRRFAMIESLQFFGASVALANIFGHRSEAPN